MSNKKKILALFLALVMVVGMVPMASAASNSADASADGAAQPSILDELTRPEPVAQAPAHADDEFVTVIVELEAPAVMEVDEYAAAFAADSVAFSMDAAGADYRDALLEQQARVKDEIVAVAGQALFRYSYTNLINGFAAYVPYGKLAEIKAIDGVSDVYETLSYDVSAQWDEGDEELDLNDFISLEEYYERNGIDAASLLGMDVEGSLQADTGSMSVLGLEGAWAKGFTGAGKVAAIFDSGLYAQNQLFQYYDLAALQEQFPELDLKTDVTVASDGTVTVNEGGTVRTKEGIKKVLLDNKTTMNIFRASWDEWFHSWEGQYPESLPSGFGSDVEAKLNAGAFYTNDKVPFNVDYANGDFNTWVEPEDNDTVHCPAFTSVSSHGTHVAGITAGNAGPDKASAMGVAGSAYDAQIFFFKVFKEQDGAGQEGDEDVFAALDDAVTLGVNVFNLSLGIPNGFTTYNNVAQAGYQRAYNSARNAGISIAISAGNDARESHPGNDLGESGGYTAILPNNSKVGGSTSTFSPYTVASAQGLGYFAWNRNNAPLTTATFKDPKASMMSSTVLTLQLADRNGPKSLGELDLGELELVYGGKTADVAKVADNAFDGKAVLVELNDTGETTTDWYGNVNPIIDGYDVIAAAMAKGAEVCVVIHPTATSASALSVSYLQGGLAFGTLSKAQGETLKKALGVGASTSTGSGSTGTGTGSGTPATPASAEVAATPAEVLFADDAPVILDEVAVEEPGTGSGSTGSGSGSSSTPAAKTIKVTFTTVENDVPDQTAREYPDRGPVSSTSWGVTDALRLTPDILSPGGNILSAGVGHPNALATMSGTSMASPNMAGCLLLVQQYVDKLIDTDVLDVEKGTLEYATVVDEIMSSTALPYQPYESADKADGLMREGAKNRLNKFFSPRRQGSGMGQLDKATSTLVYLHSTMPVGYNLLTGESQRAKIELGEIAKTAKSFDMTFVVENLDDAAHTYNVLSCLQTDATVLTESTGRHNIVSQQYYGTDIDAIGDATITVKSVTGGTLTTASTNINRYSTTNKAAVITVPKGTTTVTVTVTLPEDMKKYDDVFVNGMFVEGYVFLADATEGKDIAKVNLSIPYLGFRGDWNAAPLFDLATAYEDVSDKKVSDLDYPVYHIDNLHTRITTGTGKDAVTTDAVLGANQFTGAAVPQFTSTATVVAKMRDYLDTLRTDGNLNGDWAAFSPNNDGKADDVYAQFGLLRNTKMVGVRILAADKKTVIKDLGVEYEYFKLLASDGNLSHLVNTTAYDKYRHNLMWDGKNAEGNAVVADGQYYYQIAGLNEYDYLALVNEDAVRTELNNYIKALTRTGPLVDKTDGELAQIKAKLDSKVAKSAKTLLWGTDNAHQSIMMPVKVDTTAPTLTLTSVDGNIWTVTASDTGSGLQAIAFYYDGKLVGEPVLVNAASVTDAKLDVSEVLPSISGQFDASKLTVQAVDYALNTASADATALAFKTTVAAGAPAVTAPTKELTAEDKAVADAAAESLADAAKNSVAGTGVNEVAAEVLSATKVTEEAAEKALTDAEITVADDAKLTVVVQTYMDVQITDAKGADGKKSLTLDITPKYRTVVTTATNAGDIKLDGDDKNAAVVNQGGELKVTKPVTVSLKLPANFLTASSKTWVKHVKDNGATYLYEGSVSADFVLTFTNPNGFSEFVISSETPVATVSGIGYTSLQDAVDAVANNGTVKVEAKSGELTATVGKTVNFKVVTSTDNSTVKVAITAANDNTTVTAGKPVEDKDKKTSTTTYTCVYTAPSTPSGGGGGSSKPQPSEPVTPAPVFTDVAVGDWCYEAVKYVSDKGLINGTGEGVFSPNVTTTRAMFVTTLWRLAGEKKVSGQNSFSDVVAGSWYADAVNWAVAEGVVTGIDDKTFAPDVVVSREQIAAMLYRYAKETGKHVDNTQTLAAFNDAASVSPWAVDAVAWAVDAKLIQGKDGARLDPTGLATRAEMATILMRFCQKLEAEGKPVAK